MARFIVLKDANRSRRLRTTGVFESFGGPDAAAGSTLPPEPEIQAEDMSPGDVRDASRDPDVIAIARSMPTKLIAPSDGPSVSQSSGATWGVSAVGADLSQMTGQGVTCAVLDTGIDRNHVAFQGVNIVEKDFTGSGNGDVQGHGTHCAGTVFGRDVDGLRIGVAQGVTDALIGKVLGDDGSGGSEMLFDGIQWASSNNAQVISMSLGFDFPGLSKRLVDQGFPVELATNAALEGYRANLRMFDQLMDLIRARAVFNGGTVVVAASGNESERQIDPNFEVGASVPAAAQGIISVGALRESPEGLRVADFSNTGPVLSAPGVDVVSAKTGGGLVSFNGTSMATPHVAGLAALWWQQIREMSIPATSDGVAARLRAATVQDVFAPGVDILDRGAGLAKAPAAPLTS